MLYGLHRLSLAGAAFFASASAYAAPALWSVSDADSTVYLFGTAHVLRPESNWRTPELEAALASSKALWLEVQTSGDRSATSAIVQKLGLDPARPLESKLSADQKAKLMAVLADYGMKPAQVAPMRPWLAGITVGMLPLAKAGLDPKAGADLVLREAAKAQGHRVEGFDTPEEQVRYLADLSEADQIAFLESALDRARSGTALPLEITNAWEKGDTATIDRIMNAELKAKSPVLYRRLIVERNHRYAERVGTLLSGKEDQFVAIGVGHLVGPDSVQALMSKKGIKITRVR